MARFEFKKATKARAKGRLALIGPSGSGKTFWGLGIATRLGERVAVIDTERGSASKYADLFDFETLELESHEPLTYVSAIEAAEAEGFDVVLIDSLSHAWMGKGGALEQVDQAAARSKSGNSFAAWREVTPMHNQLVDALVGSRMHVIATMRTKVEWVIQENEKGKKEPKKIGLAPVQRDGLDYEFDVTADIDLNNYLIVDKTRCPALKSRIFTPAHHAPEEAGLEFALIFQRWLTEGVEVEASLVDQFTRRFRDCKSLPEVDAVSSDVTAAKLRMSPPELRRLATLMARVRERLDKPDDGGWVSGDEGPAEPAEPPARATAAPAPAPSNEGAKPEPPPAKPAPKPAPPSVATSSSSGAFEALADQLVALEKKIAKVTAAEHAAELRAELGGPGQPGLLSEALKSRAISSGQQRSLANVWTRLHKALQKRERELAKREAAHDMQARGEHDRPWQGET
jgi:hypothetical protein